MPRGEADLESHLENKKTQRMKPIRRLRLLQAETEADEKKDAQVSLAKALLLAGPRPDRQGMLVAATGFLDRREAEESGAIAKQLATPGRRLVTRTQSIEAQADDTHHHSERR